MRVLGFGFWVYDGSGSRMQGFGGRVRVEGRIQGLRSRV